jgi:hypothetical protein
MHASGRAGEDAGLVCSSCSTVAGRDRQRPEQACEVELRLAALYGTVALRHPCARQGVITRMLRWSDGGCEVVEGDAQPLVFGDVGGDVVVAATQVLHEGVTGGENPR